MRTYRDAKAMARALRETLAAKSHTITHSEALELIAIQFECKDWNTLASRIDVEEAPPPGGVRFDQPAPMLRIQWSSMSASLALRRTGSIDTTTPLHSPRRLRAAG